MFKINIYGESGNELPPPVTFGFTYTILSEKNDSVSQFSDRMQELGMKIRKIQADRFRLNPKPYSCENSCDWQISPTCTIDELKGLV